MLRACVWWLLFISYAQADHRAHAQDDTFHLEKKWRDEPAGRRSDVIARPDKKWKYNVVSRPADEEKVVDNQEMASGEIPASESVDPVNKKDNEGKKSKPKPAARLSPVDSCAKELNKLSFCKKRPSNNSEDAAAMKRLMLCDKTAESGNEGEDRNHKKIDPHCLKKEVEGCLQPDNPIVGVVDGDRVNWMCNKSCSASDIKDVVKCEPSGRLLHVNTGTHGDCHGNTKTTLDMECTCGGDGNKKRKKLVCASNFIKEDMEMVLDEPFCSIHIVSRCSGPIYPEHRDTIDAWCWSAIKYQERKSSFDASSHHLHVERNLTDPERVLNEKEKLRLKGEKADEELKLVGLDLDTDLDTALNENTSPDNYRENSARSIERYQGHVDELRQLQTNIDALIKVYSKKVEDAKNSPRKQRDIIDGAKEDQGGCECRNCIPRTTLDELGRL